MRKIYRYMGIQEFSKLLNDGFIKRELVPKRNKFNLTNEDDDIYWEKVNKSFYFFLSSQLCTTSGIARHKKQIRVDIFKQIESLPRDAMRPYEYVLVKFKIFEKDFKKYFTKDFGRYYDHFYDPSEEASLIFKEYRVENEYSLDYLQVEEVWFFNEFEFEKSKQKLTKEEIQNIKNMNGNLIFEVSLFSEPNLNERYVMSEPLLRWDFVNVTSNRSPNIPDLKFHYKKSLKEGLEILLDKTFGKRKIIFKNNEETALNRSKVRYGIHSYTKIRKNFIWNLFKEVVSEFDFGDEIDFRLVE